MSSSIEELLKSKEFGRFLKKKKVRKVIKEVSHAITDIVKSLEKVVENSKEKEDVTDGSGARDEH